jgi:CheY-like chemotaxis protein
MGQSIQIKQPQILVVEDEVLVRMEMVDLITDIDMPGSMDGLKLSHYVRHRWPPVKIIVASSHVKVSPDDLPDQGIFLDKPYDTPKVRALLGKISEQFALH